MTIRALVTPAVSERFWAKIVQRGDCWEWTGGTIGAGYGHFTQGGEQKMMLAHRWAYEAMVGEIPAGLVLDHLCMNKLCVNPDHLDPVTQAVNIERNPNSINKTCAMVTHCPAGHAYDEANTRWYKGGRNCRACARVHTANYRARKAAA
jgi:hypothetical protein